MDDRVHGDDGVEGRRREVEGEHVALEQRQAAVSRAARVGLQAGARERKLDAGEVVGSDGEMGVGEQLLGDGEAGAATELEHGNGGGGGGRGGGGGQVAEELVQVAEARGRVRDRPFVVSRGDCVVGGFQAGFEVSRGIG